MRSRRLCSLFHHQRGHFLHTQIHTWHFPGSYILWGRRLGPGPYDGSKTPFSLPDLSCSPAAFNVGKSSGEKDNSRFETLEPVGERERGRQGSGWCHPRGSSFQPGTCLSTGDTHHRLVWLAFHSAAPMILCHRVLNLYSVEKLRKTGALTITESKISIAKQRHLLTELGPHLTTFFAPASHLRPTHLLAD